jgi:hypothetical protein
MAKDLRCRLGRHHWLRQTAENQVFRECSRCKERDWDHYEDENERDPEESQRKGSRAFPLYGPENLGGGFGGGFGGLGGG